MVGNTKHVVNMANSIVGVSILSMPYCFKEAGLVLGVVMVLFSGLVTKKTCMFLVRAAAKVRHHSYELLAFHVFGVRGKVCVEVCMILFLCGICISFHVVMGDLAPALAAQLLHLHNTPPLRATLLLGIAVLVVLPLCLLRKLDNLASMSACSILFYFFLITVIFSHALPRLADGSWYHLARLWRPQGMLQVFPICMLGLSCQSNVFAIYDSVPDPDVPKMRSVVNGALNLCCALYISVGFFGYIAFVDQDMAGNIIMSLPATPLTQGIKLFFTASLAISFPLMIFPCRTSIHSLIYCRNTQGYDLVRNYMPESRFKGITVLILAVSVVVGIMIPNIEFVLGMLGSTMGVVISLVLPCVLFIKVNPKASVERLVAQGIMLMGVLLIVSGTYLNLTHTQQSTAASRAAADPGQQQQQQQPVIAMPPALLADPILPEKEGGGAAVPREEAAAPPVGKAGGEAVTRREPVAPEPPPDEAKVVLAAPEAKVLGDLRQDRAMAPHQDKDKEKAVALDSLHPDAIQKEEKEAHDDGAAAEYKQQELLEKIEVQHIEQQKILAEQKQILQELKDQKAQQDLAQRAAAAAAPPQQQQLPPAAAAPPQQQQQQLPPAAAPQLLPVAAPQQQLVPVVQQLPVAQQLVPAAAQQLPVAQQLVLAAPQLPAAPQQLPAAPQQQLPAAPQQQLPAAPQQQLVPAAPQQLVPAAPQQQLVPAVPQQLVPAAPQQLVPAAPQQQLVPAAPQQLVPAAPQQLVPAAPQQLVPAAPQQLVPVAPQQQLAAAPQQQQLVPAVPQQLPASPQQLPVAQQLPAVQEAVQQKQSAAPQRVSDAQVQQQAGAHAAAHKAKVAAAAVRSSVPPAQRHHSPAPAAAAAAAAAGVKQAAKKGPLAYLEKVSQAKPRPAHHPHKAPRHHDEERRRRREAAPDLTLPDLTLGKAVTGVGAGAGATGLGEAAFETRHLLWGSSRSRRRKRRGDQRGGGRGGEQDYWDET